MGLAPVFRHHNSVSPMMSSFSFATSQSSHSCQGGAATAAARSSHGCRGGATAAAAHSVANATRSVPPQPSRKDICNCCSVRFASSVLNMLMKKTCPSCQKLVCPSCLVFTLKIPKSLYMCKKCAKLSTINFEPRHLMRLHGKELREILSSMDIPYVDGSEKSELVELILKHRGTVHNWRPSHPEPPISRSLAPSTEELASPLRETVSNVDLTYVPSAPVLPDDDDDNNGVQSSDGGDVYAASEEPAVAMPEKPSPLPSPAAYREVMLQDLKSEEDIEALSIRQLKSILQKNSVDYKGCCEKWELAARVTNLWDTSRKKVDIDDIPEDDLCKICMNAPIDCVMLECGHMATCTTCGRQMNECPICRQFVVRVVHIFKA